MVIAVSSEKITNPGRKSHISKTGSVQWRTNLIGGHVDQIQDSPQAFLVEMSPGGINKPHFHEVDQFQLLVSGSGRLGRKPASVIALHYADHHTAYGPLVAGTYGLSFFTIRAKSDPGGIEIGTPGYKSMLKPSKQRYELIEDIALSTAPVLANRTTVALESLLTHDDGLGAYMVRMGPNIDYSGPTPTETGGQYYVVLNGSLLYDDLAYPEWSTIFANSTEGPMRIRSGNDGLEVIILNFPRALTSPTPANN